MRTDNVERKCREGKGIVKKINGRKRRKREGIATKRQRYKQMERSNN